jgi:hypothetical protein
VNTNPSPASLSKIDEERFGIRVAKAPEVSQDTFQSIMDFCHENDVELLIARCLSSDPSSVQTMGQNGFLLMDTTLYSKLDLMTVPSPQAPKDPGGFVVRSVRAGEEDTVRNLSAECFKGYRGHYYSDPRLDPAKCEEIYPDWAYRACISRDVASRVIVGDMGNELSGFVTLRLVHPGLCYVDLVGIVPGRQGRGRYRSFLIHIMEWARSQEVKQLVAPVSITNVLTQNIIVHYGYRLSYSDYVFHKWFDRRST